MQLKYRLPLYFSLSISTLLGVIAVIIYSLFAGFREDEFESRLLEKGQTALQLLVEVDEVDSALLTKIDKMSSGKLANQNLLIYNGHMKLLYHSGESSALPFTTEEMAQLKEHGTLFQHKENETLGLYRSYGDESYFVFVSARDKYGLRKLSYLENILWGSYLSALLLTWLLSFFISKIMLRSLSRITKEIQSISTQDHKIDLESLTYEDEIKALATSFNRMMERIEDAYKSQKEFTSNAAHELQTPIARITAQLQNLARATAHLPGLHESITNIIDDAYYLSDIITSLLLLSKIENRHKRSAFQPVRIDEILFAARSQLLKTYPDFTFQFAIENETVSEPSVEVSGDETLLKIAFQNLLHNAYSYSDDRLVYCLLRQRESGLEIHIVNHGETPDINDTRQLFTTFRRGSNTANKVGSGIGLSIVQRIIRLHDGTLQYQVPDTHTNEIVIALPLYKSKH
jgi:two-component system, OmpR family, sensor histidine kinase ArlS